MKNSTKQLIALTLAFLTTLGQAAVEEAADAPALCQINVATGKKGKGYSKLFADIRAVCGKQVALCEVETEGGLQNLTSLASNDADIGFAQLDTWQDLRSTDESIAALQVVMPMNFNLLHIVARVEGFTQEGPKKYAGLVKGDVSNLVVDGISDLKGLPVAVVGSAQKLGRVIDRANQLKLVLTDVDTDEQALAMLRKGEVAAMFSTSGWPNGALVKLRKDSGFKLVKFDLPSQTPNIVIKKNYANLGAYDVAFLGAPNLMLTRPFKPNGPNGKNVAALQTCIAKNLTTLQEGRFEPAWSEIKNASDTYGVPRFGGVAKR